jgi:hypothetical protein
MGMPRIEKDHVVRNLIERLITITGRKTDKIYALMSMETLIKDLEPKYTFLKNIKINDDFYSEDTVTAVNLTGSLNDINPTDLGRALHAIITTMNRNLGEKAGHYFIKELRNTLTDDSISTMREMGVDLGLIQLETEVDRLERNLTHPEPEEDNEP